eukprot:CAMPEP_0170464870 /NCGR_PEP_ID=MMETSP0123-20130129/9421_1 /TAXON_ID=182087 /ORGANISM="Favella ehrenbergii, Strain Fehren 1" /LENGTH=152 /DNA_ID=CAMNT_0010730613 /DNA_START=695 /DNA_END=1153 /DNA_ORIENTATION=-
MKLLLLAKLGHVTIELRAGVAAETLRFWVHSKGSRLFHRSDTCGLLGTILQVLAAFRVKLASKALKAIGHVIVVVHEVWHLDSTALHVLDNARHRVGAGVHRGHYLLLLRGQCLQAHLIGTLLIDLWLSEAKLGLLAGSSHSSLRNWLRLLA